MRIQTVVLATLVSAFPVAAQEQEFADLGTCALESGKELLDCQVGYRTFGELSQARDNAILVPTWYGGASANWVQLQSQLLGDDHDFFVIVIDALGNGVSVSPSNSESQPGESFPEITTRDMVRSQYRVATEVFELDGLHAVMGISMGGMQSFEWSVLYPDFMDRVVPIAGSPRLGAHDVALWEGLKRLFAWSAECQCKEAAEATAAVNLMNGSTSDQAGAAMLADSVQARIARATPGLDSGTALNLIRQADAMNATDVTRAFEGDWAAAAEAVEAEMFIIVGSCDHVVTPGPAIDFAGHLGDRATLVVFENDCGHSIPGCEMFRSRAVIREFLRQD
jgi:homoserine O-acetyltransferase